MDEIYGTLFNPGNLGKMSNENIEKLWNSNKSIELDDAIYNGVYYFAVQPNLKNRQCAYKNNQIASLSSYFLNQLTQNKTKSTTIQSLKNAYYAIVKPRFLMNKLSNIYWKNATSFTNGDKGTFNSVIYVLNTCGEIATTNKLEADLSGNNVANVLKDTPFTKDSLRLYQLMSIGFELYRFVDYFDKKSLPGSARAITTTFTAFISGYPKYLSKVNQVEVESPLVFFMKNLPNNEECPVVDRLLPFVTNLDS
jgi:hypothetical protein